MFAKKKVAKRKQMRKETLQKVKDEDACQHA
jgi:hypothetical protein